MPKYNVRFEDWSVYCGVVEGKDEQDVENKLMETGELDPFECLTFKKGGQSVEDIEEIKEDDVS